MTRILKDDAGMCVPDCLIKQEKPTAFAMGLPKRLTR
jgi:hypothetical protein